MTTRATTPPDTASRVWIALHEFVAGQDRRRALRGALDLGPGKVEVLIKLADGPMTLREIARAAEIDPPAATVGVDRLEARGLVHRTPHPDDNRRQPAPPTHAARAAEIDPPAATVGVDRLEARGLVHRPPHPDDNRRKLVHLTDAGRDAAQRRRAILNEPPPALTNLNSDDLARLDEILTRLQTNRRPL